LPERTRLIIVTLATTCALAAVAAFPGMAAAGSGKKAAATGRASWYGPGFAGRSTASGVRFDPKGLTAAHRNLPFGTPVRVTNLHNGRTVVVTINDRGPYVKGRVLDVSLGAARALGMLRRGVASVLIQPL
jgi:rare lipoprotein A